jgi:hypothetical protein
VFAYMTRGTQSAIITSKTTLPVRIALTIPNWLAMPSITRLSVVCAAEALAKLALGTDDPRSSLIMSSVKAGTCPATTLHVHCSLIAMH